MNRFFKTQATSRFVAGLAIALFTQTFRTNATGNEVPSLVRELFSESCLDCHDGANSEGGFDLAGLNYDLSDPETTRHWTRVLTRVRRGEMPPPDYGYLEEDFRAPVVSRLLSDLIPADLHHRGLVRAPVRRLNSAELIGTLEAVFGATSEFAVLADQPSNGHFDTEMMGLPMTESWLASAVDATDLAINDAIDRLVNPVETQLTLLNGVDLTRGEKDEQRFNIKIVGDSVLVAHKSDSNFACMLTWTWSAPADGYYDVEVTGAAFQSDDRLPFGIKVGSVKSRSDREYVAVGDLGPDGEGLRKFRVRVRKGDGMSVTRMRGGRGIPFRYKVDWDNWDRPALRVDQFRIEGPFATSAPEATPSAMHSAIKALGRSPRNLADLEEILRPISIVALRSTDPQPIADSLAAAKTSYESTGDIHEAFRAALRTLMIQPRFFLRSEGTGDLDASVVLTRLAYGLNLRPPTAREIASVDEMSPDLVKRTVPRWVASYMKRPESKSFYRRLAEQWFGLRHFNDTTPDGDAYPWWNEHVAESAYAETIRYTRDLFESNRPVTELVASDGVFVNRALAAIYDLPAPSGQELVRVSLPPDSMRGGLWTQPAITKLTANGTATSPILRGLWVLETLINEPPPPPPANVPAIEPDIRGAKTIREQLAKHQTGTCASCHVRIDPWGYALESFDPAGRERRQYRQLLKEASATPSGKKLRAKYGQGIEVDPSGVLPSGETFQDLRDLRVKLVGDPEILARTTVHKLTAYLTGLRPRLSDEPEVNAILAQTKAGGYRMRDLLIAVCRSPLMTRR